MAAQSDMQAAVDAMTDQGRRDRMIERWEGLAEKSTSGEAFFDPVMGDPRYTGESFCDEVEALVEMAQRH